MKRNTRKFIKKYYFSNTSTLLLPFFFITLSLIIFFQQFNLLSIKNSVLNNKFVEISLIYAFLLICITGFFILVKSLIKKKISPLPLDVEPFIIGTYDKEKIIRREEQQKKLKEFFDSTFNQKKYAFFVGKSGSGKSILVSEYVLYEKNVSRFNAADYSIQNDLDEKLKTIIEKCENENILRYVIIFDQFERALVNQKIFGYIIDFLKDSQRQKLAISVAFICMNEDYVRILEKLQSEFIQEPDETNDNK